MIMRNWSHKHLITLANFSIKDYQTVLNLTEKFNSLKEAGKKKLPTLEGVLITSIFFEASTRTRNSFELAAKKLSADVLSFSASNSSLSKGETDLDTALTYAAMGSDILVIRHSSSHIPNEIAKILKSKNMNTSVLNAGDGLHSHPSQGLLDLYTLTKFFAPVSPNTKVLKKKNILIVGDVLHSRVARSNIWALTACGANIILCGPKSLIPEEFIDFVKYPPPNIQKDPIKERGHITINRSLDEAIKTADAIMVLRLQKERMSKNLLSNINSYSDDYCVTPEKITRNKNNIPILHPGPVNRGIEISSKLVDEYPHSLVNQQVSNGIPVRMALLYLLSNLNVSI